MCGLERVWFLSGFGPKNGMFFTLAWHCGWAPGNALGILSIRNYFFPHQHWQISSPFQMFTQVEAIS